MTESPTPPNSQSLKVLVCGSRNWTEPKPIHDCLDANKHRIGLLIHGHAQGADRIAGGWARNNGVPEVRVPAQWSKHGRSAGPIRNKAMLALDPDLVMAFPLGESRGTRHMMKIARAAGVPVEQVEGIR